MVMVNPAYRSGRRITALTVNMFEKRVVHLIVNITLVQAGVKDQHPQPTIY